MSPRTEPEALDLWAVAAAAWDGKWILAASVLAAAIAAAIVSAALPVRLAAVATVFVASPAISTTVTPRPPGIDGYAQLAESDFILDAVRARMQSSAGGRADGVRDFRARVYVSRAAGKPSVPVIGLEAVASSAETAQQAANAWAQVLVEQQERLAALSADSGADVVLAEYPKAMAAVTEAAREWDEMRTRHAAELDRARVTNGVDAPRDDPARPARPSDKPGSVTLEGEAAQGPRYVELQAANQRVLKLDDRMSDARIAVEQARVASDTSRAKMLQAMVDALAREREQASSDAARAYAALVAAERAVRTVQDRQAAEAEARSRKMQEADARLVSLQQRLVDAEIARATQRTEVTIVAPAVAARPVPTHLGMNVLLASTAGVIVSFGAALVRFRRRQSAGAAPGASVSLP